MAIFGKQIGQNVVLSGGGGVISVADAATRFARLTGLGRLATVYQEDNGFYYQVVDPEQLDDPAGWQGLPKVYRALLSQSGTGVPVATELQNDLGQTFVYDRISSGEYTAVVAVSQFDAYTAATISQTNPFAVAVARVADDVMINIKTCRTDFTFIDGNLIGSLFEIAVYPTPD